MDMYCSGCGAEIRSGLIYCSQCGRRVTEDEAARAAYQNPMVVTAYTAGAGFVAYIFVISLLTKSGIPTGLFIPITLFYFAAVCAICFMLLRYGAGAAVGRPDDGPGETGRAERSPAFLKPANTNPLDEFREPASVTDHTTRTLDKVPAGRRD